METAVKLIIICFILLVIFFMIGMTFLAMRGNLIRTPNYDVQQEELYKKLMIGFFVMSGVMFVAIIAIYIFVGGSNDNKNDSDGSDDADY